MFKRSEHKKLNAAIIGIGGWGSKYVKRLYHNNLYNLVSCYDTNRKLLDNLSKKYKYEIKDSVEEIMSDDNIDVVFAIVPNRFHVEYAVMAAYHNKHVFLEKPIANSVTEAEKMINAFNAQNRKLYVAHSMKYLKAVEEIKSVLNKGLLGEICLLEANRSLKRGLHLTPDDWRYSFENCPGGPLLQLGIHIIDVICYLFGGIEEIKAFGNLMITESDNIDAATIIMKLQNDKLGYLGTSYVIDNIFEIKIHGTKGSIFLTDKKLVLKIGSKEKVLARKVLKDDVISREVDEFYDYIVNDKDVINTGENAKKLLDIVEKINSECCIEEGDAQ